MKIHRHREIRSQEIGSRIDFSGEEWGQEQEESGILGGKDREQNQYVNSYEVMKLWFILTFDC